MSNGITAILITSPHTCTLPRATHLIAPLHPTPVSGPDICLCLTFLDLGCPLVPRLHGIYSFAMEPGNQGVGLSGAGDAVVSVN